MSKANAKTTEKKMSKDVQIVAYLRADEDADRREVMDALHDSYDYTETNSEEYDYYRMVFAGGEKRVSEDEFEYLKDKDPAGIRMIHYTQTEENHKYGSYKFNSSLRSDVVRPVTMAMPGSDMVQRWGKKVQIDNKTIFKISMDGPEKMRKLKHQSEVESGEMFEDDDTQYWAVTMRVEVKGCKPSLYRWFDDNVVPELMANMAQHERVSQTRVMDCEKEYAESGVCFDL